MQELLHHRLLIEFLNTPRVNMGQKTFKRPLLNHMKQVSSFWSSIFSFVEQIKKQNVLQNETKGLAFEVSDLSITFFYKIISCKGGGGLGGLVTCLWILLLCLFLQMGGGSKN